jgi:hypothetical protein
MIKESNASGNIVALQIQWAFNNEVCYARNNTNDNTWKLLINFENLVQTPIETRIHNTALSRDVKYLTKLHAT